MPSCVKQTMNRQAGIDINQFSALFKNTPLSLHCVIHSLTAYNPLLDFFLFEQLNGTSGFTVLTYFLSSVSFVYGDKYKSELLQCSQRYTHTHTHTNKYTHTCTQWARHNASKHHKEVKPQNFNMTLMSEPATTVVTLMPTSEEEFLKVDSGSCCENVKSYKTSIGRIWLAWISTPSMWK